MQNILFCIFLCLFGKKKRIKRKKWQKESKNGAFNTF